MVTKNIFYFTTEEKCPKCNRKITVSLSGYVNLPEKIKFWCKDHGSWKINLETIRGELKIGIDTFTNEKNLLEYNI
jgi:hypothetical protein